MMKKTKNFNFEVKTLNIDKERNVGIVEGYASTYDNEDRDGDVFVKGAFSESIKSYTEQKQMIPMLSAHRYEDQIGGYDPSKIKETSKGLIVIGEIDLDTSLGKDKYSLAKKGFLTSFSVGFQAKEYNVNSKGTGYIFKKVDLLEISLVPVPANPEANIVQVKTATAFKDYPLMDEETAWDKDKSVSQTRSKTGSEDEPSSTYKNGFMYFDSENSDTFSAYKLPYTYVVDGQFKAVPRALSAIVTVLNGGRGGVDIPSKDKTQIERNVNGYYKKMNKDLPFPDAGLPSGGKSYSIEDTFIEKLNNLVSYQKFLNTIDKLRGE
ncbi:MAG: HK97 family phage prohead protease [Cyclobacteriaceae bacterium]